MGFFSKLFETYDAAPLTNKDIGDEWPALDRLNAEALLAELPHSYFRFTEEWQSVEVGLDKASIAIYLRLVDERFDRAARQLIEDVLRALPEMDNSFLRAIIKEAEDTGSNRRDYENELYLVTIENEREVTLYYVSTRVNNAWDLCFTRQDGGSWISSLECQPKERKLRE